ncbi:MAG: hypothetical protein KGL95_12830 [Patescibacteria group bacterium]|nr:hypothetical protein [Patescibacteria group bacterium]
MKYAFFTFDGFGLPLAKRLINEGHDVIVGTVNNIEETLTNSEKKNRRSEPSKDKIQRLQKYNGIVPKTSAYKLLQKLKKVKNPQEYFIFFDDNNLFTYANELKQYNFYGNFPTMEDKEFEFDREKAKKFVNAHYPDLLVAENKTFKKISDAEVFLKSNRNLWVLKSQTNSLVTFVPNTNDIEQSNKQILETLYASHTLYEKTEFMLEKKIQSIIEITPEKIYYDGVPLGMTINFENKFLNNGNTGIQVGCAGDLVFPVSMDSKIHDLCFPPIVDKLAKKHKGLFFWDASLLIEKKTGDMYFGEFCPNRPGFDCFYTYLTQLPSAHYFFETVVQKKSPFTLGTVGASVMLFNLSQDTDTHQIQSDITVSLTNKHMKNIWLYDVYHDKKTSEYKTVGYDNQLGPVTGTGNTITQAASAVYETIKNVQMSGLYYRPKFDYLSLDYQTSILNRLEYVIQKKLFSLPFSIQ